MGIRVALFALLSAVAGSAWSGFVVTAEQPGVQTTSVPGAVVVSFDSFAPGLQSSVVVNFGPVTGTYDKLYIRNPDIYGGANATRYPVSEVAVGTGSYTLSLNSPVNYFGLYWSAGDPSNQLDFYLGPTLVATFSTATALGVLSSAYVGNPNGGPDTGAYAYLNFFGTSGTTFDRVVFTVTDEVGGFESDNHALAVNATPGGGVLISGSLPAIATPTLSAWAEITLILMLALIGGALSARRKPPA